MTSTSSAASLSLPKEPQTTEVDTKVKVVDKAEPSGFRSQIPISNVVTPVAINLPEVGSEKKEKKKRKKNREGSGTDVDKPSKAKKAKKDRSIETPESMQKMSKKSKDRKHKICDPDTDTAACSGKKKRKKKNKARGEEKSQAIISDINMEKPVVGVVDEPLTDSMDDAKLVIDLEDSNNTAAGATSEDVTFGDSTDLAPCV